MLVIRLFRTGKKKQPSYKMVVTDRKNPPQGGKFVEQVGFYNPLTKEKTFKSERIQHWIKMGAQPSETVYNLLINEKIITGEKKKIVYKKSKKAPVAPKVAPVAAPVAAAPAEPAPAVEAEAKAE